MSDSDLRLLFQNNIDNSAVMMDDSYVPVITMGKFLELVPRHFRLKADARPIPPYNPLLKLHEIFGNDFECYAHPYDDVILAVGEDRFVQIMRSMLDTNYEPI